jgi:L-aminopeptidase/D-esterase-like protein
MDGDTLFCLEAQAPAVKPLTMMLLSTLAAEVTAMAVVNAVRAAKDVRFGKGWWPAMG